MAIAATKTMTIPMVTAPANITINRDDGKDVSAIKVKGGDCRDYDGDNAINNDGPEGR